MSTLAPFEAQIMDLEPFTPPAELNYRPSYPSQKNNNYQQQVVYNQVNNSKFAVQPQRMTHNVPQGSYMVYQGGSNQGRPITYSQPNAVVGSNRGQFR